MAIGKGGSSGNQSQSGSFTGTSNTSGTTSGTQTGQVTPNAPGGYTDAWQALLGQNGQTPQQNTASWFLNNQVVNGIDGLGSVRPAYESLGTYTAPQTAGSGSVTAGAVNPGTGASYAAPYSQLYGSGVINPILGAYDQQAGQNMNARHAAAGAGSAFGDRAAVGDAVYAGQSDVGRAALASQLANTGFTNATSLGQTDAARALQGQAINVGNDLAANQFNVTSANAVNAGNADRSLSGVTGVNLPAVAGLQNNAQTSFADRSAGAGALGNLGGMNFSQIIAALGAGAPLFGQSSTGTTTGANDSTTNASGTNMSSGSSNGKNGGVSFG